MELKPVSADQVALGRDGKRYLVTADAGNVVAKLEEIDPRIFVEFMEPPPGVKAEGFYVVAAREVVNGQSKEDLLARVGHKDFNDRLVEYVRLRNFELRHGISQGARMDAEDDAVRRANDYAFEQKAGEGAEPLMRAIQKDILGINPRVSLYRPARKAA